MDIVSGGRHQGAFPHCQRGGRASRRQHSQLRPLPPLLFDEIVRLGLERNVVELELYGYTVLHDVAPLSFFDEMRETVLRLGAEDEADGRSLKLAGPDGGSFLVKELLVRDPIFEQAVMAERPLALVTYLMGESCQISSNHGHVRGQGDPVQGLHTDAPMMPEPIPEFPVASNMMWMMDDFTKESGVRSLEREMASICRKVASGRSVVAASMFWAAAQRQSPTTTACTRGWVTDLRSPPAR